MLPTLLRRSRPVTPTVVFPHQVEEVFDHFWTSGTAMERAEQARPPPTPSKSVNRRVRYSLMPNCRASRRKR